MLDFINSCFPLIASGMTSWNIKVLIKDKQVNGVSLASVAFFAFWGCWNTGYFSYIGETISLIGYLIFAVVSIVYAGLMYHYKKGERFERNYSI